MSKKYGYPTWMTSRFIEIIPDTHKLLDALASKPRRYIRINTLKTKVKDLVERLLAIGFDIKQTILPEVF
ncbi:MAG: SAM-dependent tRNA/rRNA cytosine-C5 methylase, partial [Nitrososphaeraceae archaeon]